MLIHLAAASCGLGSQWLSVERSWDGPLKELLGVPDILDVHTLVPIGYPAYEPMLPYRRALDEIVHRESTTDRSTGQTRTSSRGYATAVRCSDQLTNRPTGELLEKLSQMIAEGGAMLQGLGVSRSFGGLKAISKLDFSVEKGQIVV